MALSSLLQLLLVALCGSAVLASSSPEDARKLRQSETYLFNETNFPENCTGVLAEPFGREAVVTVSGNMLLADTEEISLLEVNFLQLYNGLGRGLCRANGFNTITTAKITPLTTTTFSIVLTGTCQGCLDDSLFAPPPLERRELSSTTTTSATTPGPKGGARTRELQFKNRLRDVATGVLVLGCPECSAPTSSNLLAVYNSTIRFYAMDGQLPNVAFVTAIEEVPFVASRAPSVSAAPSIGSPTASPVPSQAPSQAPIVCNNFQLNYNDFVRVDYTGDLTAATTAELDLLTLNFQQIYNGAGVEMCAGGGSNVIESVIMDIQSPSSAVFNVTRGCSGCLLTSGILTGTSNTNDPRCHVCSTPTEASFLAMYDSTVRFFNTNSDLMAVSAATAARTVEGTTCSDPPALNFTAFSIETLSLSFQGNGMMFMANAADVAAVEAAVLQSYNRAAGAVCDPEVRTVTSVSILPNPTSTGANSFSIQVAVSGDCLGCGDMEDIFLSGGFRERRQLAEASCYCPLAPLGNRPPTVAEFLTIFTETFNALGITTATFLGADVGTAVPSSAPSGAPTELDIEVFDQLEGFTYDFDRAVFGSTVEAANGFPLYRLPPGGGRPVSGQSVLGARQSDGLPFTLTVDTVLFPWEILEPGLGFVSAEVQAFFTSNNTEADYINGTFVGPTNVMRSFSGLVMSYEGEAGPVIDVVVISDPNEDFLGSPLARRLQDFVENECPNFEQEAIPLVASQCLNNAVVREVPNCIAPLKNQYEIEAADIKLGEETVIFTRVEISVQVNTVRAQQMVGSYTQCLLETIFGSTRTFDLCIRESIIVINIICTNIIVRIREVFFRDLSNVGPNLDALCRRSVAAAEDCYFCGACSIGFAGAVCCDDSQCPGAICVNNKCISADLPRLTLKWYGNDNLGLNIGSNVGVLRTEIAATSDALEHRTTNFILNPASFPTGTATTFAASVSSILIRQQTTFPDAWQVDFVGADANGNALTPDSRAFTPNGAVAPFTYTRTTLAPTGIPSNSPSAAPITPSPVTAPPVTPSPVTPSPVTPAPVTPAPVTGSPVAPDTPAPVTPAPVTPAPVTPAPVTPAPVTPAPVTPAPVTPAPVTPAPVTPAPVTPAPVTPAPVTPAPVTPAPVTPAPVTPAPVTPAPVTDAPSQSIAPSVSNNPTVTIMTRRELEEQDETPNLTGFSGRALLQHLILSDETPPQQEEQGENEDSSSVSSSPLLAGLRHLQ